MKTLPLSRMVLCFILVAATPQLRLRAQRPLSFEDRVKAQEAIERVYYAHLVWPKENPDPKPPFEQAVPRGVTEAKVVSTLQQCAALGSFWRRPIAPEQLQAEMERMAKGSKDPATLEEVFSALHHDPLLIAECLARPLLADRLIREWYAFDSRIHGETRARAQAALASLAPSDWPGSKEGRFQSVVFTLDEQPPACAASGEDRESTGIPLSPGDFRRRAEESPAPGTPPVLRETADAFVLARTIRKSARVIELESLSFPKKSLESWLDGLQSGASRYEPEGHDHAYVLPKSPNISCNDTWAQPGGLYGAPGGVYGHTAVWTGTEMIVWGGYNGTAWANTGGRYNPSTDSWCPTSTGSGVPDARYAHTAVWTGTEMVIWGGDSGTSPYVLNTGGRYNPSTDTWTPTSTGSSVPEARDTHAAVWTGTEMIIWGGEYWAPGWTPFATGGRYNPATDEWAPTSVGANLPQARWGPAAVWTGTEMIVWGGEDYSTGGATPTNTGGRYNPSTDSWTPTSMDANVPSPRNAHSGIWTGTEMIVWGGTADAWVTMFNTGGRYNPSTDSWTPTSMGDNVPSPVGAHTAVWTGSRMVVWGGYTGSASTNAGGQYDPVADAWISTSMGANAASPRYSHTAVWTDSEMIVWGGYGTSSCLNTGGRYSPTGDSWVPTFDGSTIPSARYCTTPVWTGTEMIVWGNWDGSADTNTGGRYNPATDSWAPTSTGANVPDPRQIFTAVWTGTEIIIWGGWRNMNTGGRYNPLADTWRTVSTSRNCPDGRSCHAAVWTGTEMIVWGGWDYIGTDYNTGARYSPLADVWLPTSTGTNTPSPLGAYPTAVWTGSEMIVWGGVSYLTGLCYNTGGRYNPASNSWLPTSTGANVPDVRTWHTAVWTGSRMIIWGGSHITYQWESWNTGGVYDPVADSWSPTSTGSDVPQSRAGHTAVWTGTEMIIWGGYTHPAGPAQNTGGRYTPATDSWRPTSTEGTVPTPRSEHGAVWTGSDMIVWGGATPSGVTSKGGVLTLPQASLAAVVGSGSNICPATSVALSVNRTYSSYQWRLNGTSLPGATGATCTAPFSGNYSVEVTDSNGCAGVSSDKAVTVSFCSGAEVSYTGAYFPAHLAATAGSPTGFYLTFQKVDGAWGYNFYEGEIGSYYSHGGAPGNVCNVLVEDLGAGQMRAAISPSEGNHYYLVTAFDAVAQGPSGFASSGAQIPPSQSTCPP